MFWNVHARAPFWFGKKLSAIPFAWHNTQGRASQPRARSLTYRLVCFSGMLSQRRMSGSEDMFNLIDVARRLSKKAVIKHMSMGNILPSLLLALRQREV